MLDRVRLLFFHQPLLRYGACLCLLGFYVIACTMRALDRPLYELISPLFIGYLKPHPFGDLGAIMQAGLCWRVGVDVYQANQCMGGGNYNYSLLLLRAAYLPYTMQAMNALGVGLDVVFILSLAALPPATSRTEICFRAAAYLSSSVIYAIEQANFDVVIFLMVLLGGWLLLRDKFLRLAGYMVLVLAASCKFYPVLVLGVVIREPVKRFFLVLGFILACALLYWWYFGAGTEVALKIIPNGKPYGDIFGAGDLPAGLPMLLFSPTMTLDMSMRDIAVATRSVLVPVCQFAGPILLIALTIIRALFVGRRYGDDVQALDAAPKLFLGIGMLVITGCFFLSQNIIYREIFLLFAVPGLASLYEASSGWRRVTYVMLSAGLLVLLWEPTIRELIGRACRATGNIQIVHGGPVAGWLFYELVWWWVVIKFCQLLVAGARPDALRLWAFISAKPPPRRRVPG